MKAYYINDIQYFKDFRDYINLKYWYLSGKLYHLYGQFGLCPIEQQHFPPDYIIEKKVGEFFDWLSVLNPSKKPSEIILNSQESQYYLYYKNLFEEYGSGVISSLYEALINSCSLSNMYPIQCARMSIYMFDDDPIKHTEVLSNLLLIFYRRISESKVDTLIKKKKLNFILKNVVKN
jgi:hypothetical protein